MAKERTWLTSEANMTKLKEKRQTLRNNLTPAEVALWKALQNKQLDGYKFRRQFSVGNYIMDFYCTAVKLCIELDGAHHFTQEGMEYDKIRTEYLKSFGITVLRFENQEIWDNFEKVLEKIREVIGEIQNTIPPAPLQKGGNLESEDLQKGGSLEGGDLQKERV